MFNVLFKEIITKIVLNYLIRFSFQEFISFNSYFFLHYDIKAVITLFLYAAKNIKITFKLKKYIFAYSNHFMYKCFVHVFCTSESINIYFLNVSIFNFSTYTPNNIRSKLSLFISICLPVRTQRAAPLKRDPLWILMRAELCHRSPQCFRWLSGLLHTALYGLVIEMFVSRAGQINKWASVFSQVSTRTQCILSKVHPDWKKQLSGTCPKYMTMKDFCECWQK